MEGKERKKQSGVGIAGQGAPIMVQAETNPTRHQEVAGLIPDLTQWVKDLALP